MIILFVFSLFVSSSRPDPKFFLVETETKGETGTTEDEESMDSKNDDENGSNYQAEVGK